MCIANKKVLPSQILQMLTVCNLNSPACKSQSLFKKVVDSKCSDKVCIRHTLFHKHNFYEEKKVP